MIYQMQIYYGAMIGDKVIYCIETCIEDCETFPKNIDKNIFLRQIKEIIINDGFNPDDFVIGYLTSEQYKNRFTKDKETINTIIIKNCKE